MDNIGVPNKIQRQQVAWERRHKALRAYLTKTLTYKKLGEYLNVSSTRISQMIKLALREQHAGVKSPLEKHINESIKDWAKGITDDHKVKLGDPTADCTPKGPRLQRVRLTAVPNLLAGLEEFYKLTTIGAKVDAVFHSEKGRFILRAGTIPVVWEKEDCETWEPYPLTK